MRRIVQLLVGSLTVIGSFFATSDAHAGIDACGNINVEANAQCEMKLEGGCTAACTPISFEASCAAELTAGCSGQCNASFTAECTGACNGSCVAECEANPPAFSCTGSCNADCSADCGGRCAAEANRGECEASCKASCSAECDASCQGSAGNVDCNAQCQMCCEGSCTAEANLDCQISCQASGYVDCKANLQGGCEVACSQPEGALFCDGQYIDHGGNLEECVAALQALLNIEVTGYANAECSGGSCTAEAGAEASCSVPAVGGDVDESGLALLAAGLGIAVAARRRRRA